MAKQKKPAAVMARPNSTWFQNALKSVGAASGDIIKDLLPYTSESVGSIVGVAKDVRNTIRKSASTGKSVSGQLEKNSLIQMGRKALQNAAEDLKSGNLYNTDRGVDFGGDFNFDDVDMSFGDFDEGSDYGDNTVINNVNTVDSGAVLAVRDSVDKQTNATIAGATATVNTMVAVSSNMMMANQKNMGEVLSHLSSIDTNIASMITYMNENVTKFIEASIAHYQEMAPAKNDENASSSSDDKATSATIFGDSGFNANEYVKYVKQNIKNSTVGGLFGTLKDLAPMLMGGAVANPIGEVMKAVGKNMISKDFKKSLAEFDKTFKSFLPTMLERLSEKAFDYTDDGAKGTLMRTLGSIFGVRTSVKNEFARKEYKNGPTPFDNETKLAITEVIPSYLRDILAEISGNEKQVFDKQTMKFRNISELQNEIYGDIYNSIIGTFKNSDVGKKLNNRQSRLDSDDQEKFEDLVNRLYLGLSRSSGEIDPRTLGSDDALTRYLAGGDSAALNKMKQDYGPILSYLVETLNSLSESEKSSLNFTKIRARQNREARKREMEDAPDLYNLNLTNDGTTIDQGMNEYHKRAYSAKNNATVVGTSTNKRYNPRNMMEDIASIKSILYRGINVKIVDEFGAVEGQGNDGNPPSGGNNGGNTPPKPVGHSVEDARRQITEEQELSAELAQYEGEGGGAPTKTVNTITNFMQAMINGGPSAASDVVSQAVMSGFSKAESWLSEHVLNPISKIIFGDKDKDENDKGIFGGIRDSFSDMVNGAIHSLTGKGYTKKNPADGEDAVVADSENSLAHKAKKLFNNIKEGAAEYLFGKKNEETGKRDGGFIGSMKQKLNDGLEGWAESIFGKSKEGEPTPGEKLKGYVKKAIPSALGGHVIGTMVSSLMGGSILGNAIAPGIGGLIGSGIGMISKSEKFKNWLFGHEDKDGRYIKGVLSKKTQQTLKESKNMILGGGALGLLKGLIFPSAAGATGAGLLTSFVGGPVAGMLMGAGLGMVKKSKWFQEMMYGKDGPDGKHINGIKDKLKNFFSKNGGKDGKSGGGYKGGMALLGGAAGAGLGKLLLSSGIGTSMGLFGAATMPILGGVMGAGLGILNSSEKFRKMMFGDIDEETGKRKGNGLIGKLGMWMNVNIMEPMKYGAEYVKTKMVFAGKRMLKGFSDMLDPLKTRINQIKDSIIDKLTDFRHGLMGVVKNVVVKPLKKAGEVMMVPLRFIGKQGFKLGTALLKAPMDALSLVFKTMTKSLNLKNIKGFIKDGWKHAKRAIGDTIKRAGHSLFENTFGVLRDTLKKHLGNESKFGKWAKKWLSPVQKALVDGAKGIFKWITGGIKKILGLPFKALGWAISAPFKLLGKAVGAVGKVARTGVGLMGVAMNAKESDENGNATGLGMRDKLKASLGEKAQEWAKKTGRDASEYGGPRKWLDTLKLLDPGYARLDSARRNGEIRDTVTVTDKKGKTHEKKLNKAVDEQDALSKELEDLSIERLEAKYHLGESRKNAKRFKYDPTKKEEILGEDRVYEGITAKGVASIDAKIKNVEEKQKAIADAISGSSEEELKVLNEGNTTSAEIAAVVRRGGEPGSIYTHDVHGEGILKSIYTFLVRRFSGATVSEDDLDKISNPHLNDGIVSNVTDGIFEDAESVGDQGGVSAKLATPDDSTSIEDTIKNLAASGTSSDIMESVAGGDDAVLAVQNSELRSKDEEEDKERNEKQEAKSQAGLEKAQTDAKRLREEAAEKEKDSEETSKKQTNILSRLLETTKSHTKSWFETFDLKKGVITAGIIALAPFAIKLIKSIMDGTLFGSFITDVLNCFGTTISNIFANFATNGGAQGIVTGAEEVGSRVVKMASFDPTWAQNSQGDVDSLGSATIRYATKNGFKIANNAMAGFMKKSGLSKKLGTKIATKSLKHTGGVTKAAGGVTKTIAELIGSFVKWLGKKFPKIGSKVGQKVSKKLTGEVIEKVAKKGGAKIIGAATAKTVSAAVSFGASELVWGILGGIDGAVKAAQLFEVREEDVDASMRVISSVFCALLGTTVGTVIDIIAGVAEAIIGTNFVHEAAQLVWALGKSDEEKQYYQNKKEMFKDDWRQEAYIKYKEQAEQAGEIAVSQEEFLASGDENIANASGLTLSDYNNSQNKDMWGKIGDWFSDLFGGNKKKSSTNRNAAIIDTMWAGGVVKGTEPRLTILSPGEIVYNPAGPEERAYQRRREEAARDRIYSRLSINADANELGTSDVDGSIVNATKPPEIKLLEKISEGVSNSADKLISINNVLYGMYSSMIGADAFNLASESDIKNASKHSKGIIVDSISNLEDVFYTIMNKLGLGKKKVKVKISTGEYVWINESDASKYQSTTVSESGAGRGKSEDGSETVNVGNAKLYQQEDPAWNTPKYRNLDIYNSGCGPTAASIAASVYGSSMTPVEAASVINSTGNRDYDGGTMPRGIEEAGKAAGVNMKEGSISESKISDSLSRGNPVILMGQDSNGKGNDVYGDGMHYVVGTGYDSKTGEAQILDPLSKQPKRRKLRDFIRNTESAIYTKANVGKGRRKFGKGALFITDILSNLFKLNSSSEGVVGDSYHDLDDLLYAHTPEERVDIIESVRAEQQEKNDRDSYYETNDWMTAAEKRNFAQGLLGAKITTELPPSLDESENVIFTNSYSQIKKHRNDSGYRWFRDVDQFWKNEYSSDKYKSIQNMIDGRSLGSSFFPMWMTFDNLSKNYGIKNTRWKQYYKYMSNEWLLNGYHATISSVDNVPNVTTTAAELTNVTSQTKENKINDIVKICKTMVNASYNSNDYDVKSAINTSRMLKFIDVEFGSLAQDLISYVEDRRIRVYIKPMVEYCDKMDSKVVNLVNMPTNDIDSIINKYQEDLTKLISSGDFKNESDRASLFGYFTKVKSVSNYLSKHFYYFRQYSPVKTFTEYIIMQILAMDRNVNIGSPDYLSGKTITVIGNVSQCELIRLSFDKMKKLKYSNDRKNDIDQGYANSATAIAYLYSQIGLPIPLTGYQMYLSGKAVSPLVSGETYVEITNGAGRKFGRGILGILNQVYVVDSMNAITSNQGDSGSSDYVNETETLTEINIINMNSEEELIKYLYAGDILLYTDSESELSSSIQHVEMYAGDGMMIGHSGGSSGSTMGLHASKFRKEVSGLILCGIRRFIKMADTTIYTLTMNPDKGIITQDGEDVSSTKTPIFEKLAGFIGEVASRMWNGLLTGEWDSDYTDFWSDNGWAGSYKPQYAADGIDKETPVDFSEMFPPNEMTKEFPTYDEIHQTVKYDSNARPSMIDVTSPVANVTSLPDVTRLPGYGRGKSKREKDKGRGRYGRGNSYTPNGQTTVLPKGLGWYAVNEGWGAITAQSPQLDLKNRAQRNQSSLYDSDGYGKYGDRYVVATTRTFGEPGDYIDIEQNDGNVIPAIIGDIKAWGVDTREGRHVNKWGHNDGDVVLEFLKDSSNNSFHTNPTDPGDPMYSTLYGKTVASITNRGNALQGADPINPSGKLSRMSYSVTKHSGTDGANTLSPLSEGYEEWAKSNGVKYGYTCPSGESVYDNPDEIYKYAPRPDGTSTYASAELSLNSGNSYTTSNSNDENSEEPGAMTILQNVISGTMSRLGDYMFNGGELKALTEEEIRTGSVNSAMASGSTQSSASSYTSDRYYTYPEDDGQGALPDSLITSNDEYGKKVAEENAAKTANNRTALYDPTLYTSTSRADGWFLNSMPYSKKTSSFGEDYIMSDGSHLWTPCHKGIDIGAGTDTEIYSPVDGTVSAVVPESSGSGFGNYVTIIDEKKKYHHIFAHQNKFADGISVGKKVKRGDLVGYVGSTGYSTGPHLHYQIDASGQNGSYINPNSFPFSIYNTGSTGDINETESYETTNIDVSKGGRTVKDPLAVYKTLKKTIDESKVQAQRSKRDKSSEEFSKGYGKGGDGGTISTARLESLTETMIEILNTIADNTLSSSEKLDNIKSSAINMNLPKSTAKKSTNSNSSNSPSTGIMSSNERFARQIARGI